LLTREVTSWSFYRRGVTAGGHEANPIRGAHHTATASAKRPFHEAMSRRTRRARHCWQVFGLAGAHQVVLLMVSKNRSFPVSGGPPVTSAYLFLRRRSFLLTAAGQSRTFTGFPFARHR